MKNLNKINIKDYEFKPFLELDDNWALLTAGNNQKATTMTISWANIGIAYNKPTILVYVRPNRYTRQFIDNETHFSITFFDDIHRKELMYHGTVSGHDEDKIARSNLSLDYIDGIPYFKEAHTVYICKKIYQDTIKEDGFYYKDELATFYNNEKKHIIYLAEIEKIYQTN